MTSEVDLTPTMTKKQYLLRFPREVNDLILRQLIVNDDYDALRIIQNLHPQLKEILSKCIIVLCFYDSRDQNVIHNLKNDPKINRLSNNVVYINLWNFKSNEFTQVNDQSIDTQKTKKNRPCKWSLKKYFEKNYSYLQSFKMINIELRMKDDCIDCQLYDFNLELFQSLFHRIAIHIQIYRTERIFHCFANHGNHSTLFDNAEKIRVGHESYFHELAIDIVKKITRKPSKPKPLRKLEALANLDDDSSFSLNSNIRTIDLICARADMDYCCDDEHLTVEDDKYIDTDEAQNHEIAKLIRRGVIVVSGDKVDYDSIGEILTTMNSRIDNFKDKKYGPLRKKLLIRSAEYHSSRSIAQLPNISLKQFSNERNKRFCNVFGSLLKLESNSIKVRTGLSDNGSYRIRIHHTPEELQNICQITKEASKKKQKKREIPKYKDYDMNYRSLFEEATWKNALNLSVIVQDQK